jgi:hypothetical protein
MTPLEQVLAWSAVIIAVGGALGVLWKITNPIVQKSRKLVDSLNKFTEDWFGSEAEPGRDKVPGVMERLNNIDGELKHNGGSTMKDSVKRIETSLSKINARLEEGEKRFEALEKRAENL